MLIAITVCAGKVALTNICGGCCCGFIMKAVFDKFAMSILFVQLATISVLKKLGLRMET